MSRPLFDPELFEQLKRSSEEETRIGQDLKQHIETLEREVSLVQGVLSRVHSTPRAKYAAFLGQVEEEMGGTVSAVRNLADFARQYPYYKYNNRWTRAMQDALATAILCAWLGGRPWAGSSRSPVFEAELGHLLTLDEAGQLFHVPANLHERDDFHVTIEEYLAALVSVTDELSRLAMNSVTLGDVAMAVRISGFVKDVHAGFQVLNLKNDSLRKRVDGVKYHVKKVEDVIYDLSLRNLLPVKVEEQDVKAEEQVKTDDAKIKSEWNSAGQQ